MFGSKWYKKKKIKENNFLFMFDCVLDNIKEN